MLEGRRRRPKRRRRRPERRRRGRPGGRRPSRTWWWSDDPIWAKALRMFGLGGSSHSRVGLRSLPSPASFYVSFVK
jgi:hypothetical protein